jgi:hypothetical protein
MRRPWKQRNEFSELESDLRAARPEPRSDLISKLVGRVEANRLPVRRSGVRLVLAGVLTSGALVAFALVGGFSYTAAAAKSVAKATGVSNGHSNKGGNRANSNANSNANPSANQYQEKVVICHRPPGNPSNAQTLTVGAPAAQQHLAQHPDDTLGPCP